MKITFLGATNTVTGSKTLVEHEGKRILVDCGLYQGFKYLREKNRRAFPIEAKEIDAIILTHAHLDHCGYLPVLVRQGYRKPVYCTAASRRLAEVILLDSARLQEEDADYANREGFSKHHPALPLYTTEDVEQTLKLFRAVDYDKRVAVAGFNVTFNYAGHILGAASVHLEAGGKTVAFSGDLGRSKDFLMRPPSAFPTAHTLVLESTYGNRVHPDEDPLEALAQIVNETVARGGTLIVPAFAIGRAQLIMHLLAKLKTSRKIPHLPIFLDSPMALEATEIFLSMSEEHRLSARECDELVRSVESIRSVEQSKILTHNPAPKVIISASGMATGGRVLHHLKHYLPHSKNTVLFTGFQAGGTRGATMLSGAEFVKIHGNDVRVRAEIKMIETLSAHADSNELIEWIKMQPVHPKQIFLVHGEPEACDTLRRRIRDELLIPCKSAEYQDEVVI